MDEATAREELRALGIRSPSPELIRNLIRAARAEEELQRTPTTDRATPPKPTSVPPTHLQAETIHRKRPRGHSKSNLEPTLREQGALQRQSGPRRPGRPRIIASWFPEVAQNMADGKSLKDALKQHGLTLDQRQIRALYRNEEFRKLCREPRQPQEAAPSLPLPGSGTARNIMRKERV